MVLTILLAARHKRAHPALTPAGEGWYSIYLPRRDGRLSWPSSIHSVKSQCQSFTNTRSTADNTE